MLSVWLERLGLGGREMTASGHSRNFVLRVVQPALIGLMDGSVSTLAPLFATAFATRAPGVTFLVGLAAAVGAGISMGFSEGLSDDGSLTGRGSPLLRGVITGFATSVGGILHTLPFLIPHVSLALYLAFGVVGFELLAISFIRYRYFDMSFVVSAFQVCVGGALVFAAGILIGSA
jgi:VIT1/CCC1 family predicted Fe2+/Mn2+ transporter